MGPQESIFWNVGLGKAWRRGHAALRKSLLPVLDSDAERMPEHVSNHIKEEWEKVRRRSSIFDGTDKFPRKGPDVWRAEWDFTEKAADITRVAIHSETVGNVPRGPEDSVSDREIGIQAYEYALSRLGKQGVRFLDELIASGGNVSRASKAAEVSRVTGHKWRTELQTLLSGKKLSK